MFQSKEILLLLIFTFLGITTGEECLDTNYAVSKCDKTKVYQWLIEVPTNKEVCKGKSVSQPKAVECNFACPKGQTFDRDKLKCKDCTSGTFSLGGGHQYIFNEEDDREKTMPELSLKIGSVFSTFESECKGKELWKVKGNILQGDAQRNCAIYLSLQFKLERAGSITIAYNLATSYVFGSITSRCDFSITDNDNNDDIDDDERDSKKRSFLVLYPTGYGIWKDRKIDINAPGEYILSLYTVGLNAFHFPLSIRSIIVEGSSFLQDCILCPKGKIHNRSFYDSYAFVLGTYASKSGSTTCKPCASNTYAPLEGSTQCLSCKSNEYADEGSAECLPRPKCELKHYQQVFIGCDKSDTATIKYEPIQPKVCIGDPPSTQATQSTCRTCNPGMYKNTDSGLCEFCPQGTYSDGTLSECRKCKSELSVLPGLYYKNWNELPMFFNRSYMSFYESKALNGLVQDQSWIPSIAYISSQALPDVLSILSLNIVKGFRLTELARANRQFGTLYFTFSIQCQKSCTLFLVSLDTYAHDDDWSVIQKWNVKHQVDHKDIVNYTHSIQSSDEITFIWLFTSDNTDEGVDEIRIYEIFVTNTALGGSDRCVSCLTTNNQETECKSCAPGHILSNGTCIHCPSSTMASRMRPNDLVPTICKPCMNNTISDDGISCYIPCKQAFNGSIQYDLNAISTVEFHGSKLFTQKGSGYFHVFNASICGKTSVTCGKTLTLDELQRSKKQTKIESKLCRMGTIPNKNDTTTSVAYVDDFGEQLLNVTLSTSKYFPPLRSDYNLTDITLVYRANTSTSQTSCSERITFLSLRCDHLLDDEKQNSSIKYKLQTPNDCVTGTCDGCIFYFLLRTPFACPICDNDTNGYRTFFGPCKFGRQEVRKIPYPYCSHNLTETVETHRCSILSLELQIIFGVFIIIAGILILIVIICWRKNRKLEYRYMQLIENTNPDDDTPVDNVCAQLSDEEDSGDEVQFKSQSRAKKIMNVVRKAIRKNPNNGRAESFGRDSYLLTSASTNDA
ncbi:unnamed protein product [Rotaria sordida]|uniref:MRH domain-containing protein n=2 Tax=Rotaria sordida TaxID=392033 RepID=A0A814IMD5_9BILA|nr:unnamed protein product [Rotaria sordida]